MSYPFPPELQQLVSQGLASGQYPSEEEMLTEAMRLLQERDAELQRFKAQLARRVERLDRGEGIVLEGDNALDRYLVDLADDVDRQIAARRGHRE